MEMQQVLDSFGSMLKEVQSERADIELMRESLVQKALALEDVNWLPLLGPRTDQEGLGIDTLHRMVPDLQDMAATNPLHVRGAQLRHAYVFGRGVNFSGLTERTKKLLKDPYNKAALFSVQAYETNNLAMFTDGNLFVIRDEKTNILTVVPLAQITAAITDPDDTSKVRYFRRAWSDGSKQKVRWYPLARYKKSQIGRGKTGGKINKTITVSGATESVAQDQVIYHHTTKRQVGWTYGVPDSLAAKIWAIAYSNYLTDNATLIKALSQFAWTITNQTKTGKTNAAVAIAEPGAGGTAAMGSGNVLSSVGVPSAQVNMNNGQPLAALVATSFGVPVIALLSSPGATGGSYGAATTLDTPTLKGMKATQDSWIVLYDEIVCDMGSPDVVTSFPNISQDETYREMEAVALGYTTGLFHQDEARQAGLDLVDIEKLHDEVPKPDAFNAGGNKNDKSNPVPSQGNSGAVPGGVDQNTTNHDGDN